MKMMFQNWLRCSLACVTAALMAADHRGVVKFGGLPLPGASVTVTQKGKKHAAITDSQGSYSVPVTAEPFAVDIEMQLFAPAHREFTDAANVAEWEVEILKPDQ